MNRFFLFLSLLLVVLLGTVNSVLAQTCTWTGNVNNDWSNSGNWTGGVPTSSSDVIINGFNAIMSKSSGSGGVPLHSLTITSSQIELGMNFTGITVNSSTGAVPTYTFKVTSSKITPQNTGFSIGVTAVSPVLITNSTLGTTTTAGSKYAVTITNSSTSGDDGSNQSVIVAGYYPAPPNPTPITFDGAFTCSSNSFKFTTCVFNGTTTITKAGNSLPSINNAGNKFNGIVTLTNSGSADLSWGNGDFFNSTTGLVTLNNNSTGYFYIASSSTNTTATFYGPLTANNISSGFLVFSNTIDNVVAFVGTAIKAVNLYNTSTGQIQLSNAGAVTFTYANLLLGNIGSGGTYIGYTAQPPATAKSIAMDAFTTFNVNSSGTSVPIFTSGLLSIDRLSLSGSTGSTSISLGSSASIDFKSGSSWGRPVTVNAYRIIGIGGTWTNSHTFNILSGAAMQYTDTYHNLSITGSVSFNNNATTPWNIGGISNPTTGAPISTGPDNTVTFSSPFNFYRSTCTIQTNSTGDITFGYSPSTINFTNIGINLKRNGATAGSIYFGNLANININSKDSTLSPTQYEKSIVTIDQSGATAYNATQQKWLPQISLGSIGTGAGLCTFFGYMTTTNFKGGCLNFANFSGLTDVIVTSGTTPDATTLVSFSANTPVTPTLKPTFSRSTCIKCQNIVSTGGVFGTQPLTTPSAYSWTTTFSRVAGAVATNPNYFTGTNIFSSQVKIYNFSTESFIFGNVSGDSFNYFSHVTLQKNAAGLLKTSGAGVSNYYGDYNYYGTPDGNGTGTAMAGQSIFAGSVDQTIYVPAVGAILRFNLLKIGKFVPLPPALPSNVLLSGLVNVEGASGELNLTAGNIKTTSTNLLSIDNGSIITGGNNISFIDGPLKKTGNIPAITPYEFKFHIGKTSTSGSIVTNIYMPVSITMPLVSNASTYTAEFFNSIEPMGDLFATGIKDFNRCQYWVISHTGSNESIAVTLPWDNTPGQTCYPVNSDVVCVAEYSIGQWTNVGSNTTVSGIKGTVKSNVLGNQLTGPYIYFAIGYRNALVINTFNTNPTKFKTYNNVETTPIFTSGASGTAAGTGTALSNTKNVNGNIVIHPSFSSVVDLQIDEQLTATPIIDPKAEYANYSILNTKIYTSAAGVTNVVDHVTIDEDNDLTFVNLSSDVHTISGNTLTFYKERPAPIIFDLTNNLTDAVTYTVNRYLTTPYTPFQITSALPSGYSATLKIYDIGNVTLYNSAILSWDAKSGATTFYPEGLYRYDVVLTNGTTTKTYKGQLILKHQ